MDVPQARSSVAGLARALLSGICKDATNLATPELKDALVGLLEQEWDWIVIDHANSAGLLQAVESNRKSASICYVAHNAEGKARPEIAMKIGNFFRRSIMRLDAENYRRLELRVVDAADVVLCIADTDASYFSQYHRNVHVIPPVYLGTTTAARDISEDCPRAVLLVGSFDWVAKQENLESIVRVIVPILARSGITLNVVGSVPDSVRQRLATDRPNLKFHGLVSDIAEALAGSRGGLVAEDLGGGFKLKVLDYAFNRVPIFGLNRAMGGTTAEERRAMILADDMESLGTAIVQNIDNLPKLNQSQNRLFDLVSDRFGMKSGIGRLEAVFPKQRKAESGAGALV
ncbi:glycosyltransferase [Bradyrhizobium sp. JYMT SZCCT0428]|uniref:glycosyltransferase n=1 Tax=Bradyrhizobium sp. JYMT SZCCT0428 TaxID=2807673 RepID=UPI003908B82B